MKKLGILVCLLGITSSLFAATFMGDNNPRTSFQSTSIYRTPSARTGVGMKAADRRVMSASARDISAENFLTLNSEGGACYRNSSSSSGPRKGRSTSGSATGTTVWQSPVGDIPCLFFLLLAIIYGVVKRKNASNRAHFLF